ncbi:cupin domain-containing protein [Streptomyces sp. KLOTTS4A1]|uniref:cupin domain-containing protein n=1 Tax=Streptomyces sp. KLOTTS4A1 TaxID=3390996 RepID=UPI0039F62EF2
MTDRVHPRGPSRRRPRPADSGEGGTYGHGGDGGSGSGGATGDGGTTGTVLAKGTSGDTLQFEAKGRTDVTFRTVTIAPGGTTGWHYHPGQVLAVVKQGTLTRTLADRSVEVSPPGSTVLEPGGAHDVHVGRNLGTTPVILYVTYLLPEGSPLALSAPAPVD